MSALKYLKVLARSRSIAFTKDYIDNDKSKGTQEIRSFKWQAGDGRDIFYRTGTSDVGIIYDVLVKPGTSAEYFLPPNMKVNVILDVGANIGATSRYLAHLFPRAAIHAFEPIPANFELLMRNTEGLAKIFPHPFGLGPSDGQFELRIGGASTANQGGYSLFANGSPETKAVATIRDVRGVLAELNVASIDIIKIDTEGAEFSILSAFPNDILKGVSWLYGELHTEHIDEPTDFKVLDLLSPCFYVGVYKPMFKRNYSFDACRKDLHEKFRRFRRRR